MQLLYEEIICVLNKEIVLIIPIIIKNEFRDYNNKRRMNLKKDSSMIY